MTELLFDENVIWNSASLREVDEAKKCFIKYRREGYEITDRHGSVRSIKDGTWKFFIVFYVPAV